MLGHYWSVTAANADEAWRLMLNYQYLGANTVFSSADKKIGWNVCCLNDTITNISSIENVKNEIEISVHPNPTTSLITLSLGSSPIHIAIVELYNLQGNLIFSETFQNNAKITIDLTDYSAGVYLIKVIADGVSYEEKIIKE